MIYFDHQASTPVLEKVLEKMLPFFKEFYANPHSSDHVFGWTSSTAIEQASSQIADMIGCDSDEIIFTSGATESNNLSLIGLAKKHILRNGKRRRLLLSSIEHKCILEIGKILLNQLGFKVDLIMVDKYGLIDKNHFLKIISDDVLAVSIMAVNNEIGSIQDIKFISDVCRKYGVIFHSDGAQAPVGMDLNIITRYVDLLSLSGHKMYGPKGIGALYIRRDLQNQIEPVIYGSGQQNGLRSGTLPTPLCVGMGAAAQLLTQKTEWPDRVRLGMLRDQFEKMVLELNGSFKVNGPISEQRHPGNSNIMFKGFSAQDLLSVLQPQLAASSGAACSSGIPEPSHVLSSIGLNGDDADSSIRFSLGLDTSTTDVMQAVDLIKNAIDNLSKCNCHIM